MMPFKDKGAKREYQRLWRQRNAEYQARQAVMQKKRKRENKEYVKNLKEQNPCTDCGIKFPYYVMQFDHIGDDKVAGINKLLHHSLDAIKEEISKCELVCANCHAHRTQMRYAAATEDEGVLSPKVSVRLASAVPMGI